MPRAAEDTSRAVRPRTDGRDTRVAAIVAVALIGLAALRAAIGVNLHDGTQYLVAPLRLAQGARLLADEMPLQTTGYLASVPFMRLWTARFGLTGISLATALYYIAVASLVGLLGYRLLRPTFGPVAAALAVGLPLLAPPYHLFLPSYNTTGELAFLLAACLAFAAMRDESGIQAGGVGVALAAGVVAYPALLPAAFALLATFAVLSRRTPRLVASALLSFGLVAAAVVGWLFSAVSAPEVRAALAYDAANVSRAAVPVAKVGYYVLRTVGALLSPVLWPMWALAAVSSVRRVGPRSRAAALAVLPLAAAVPGVVLIAKGDGYTFGAMATTWLVAFLAGAIVPAILAARRSGRTETVRLIVLGAPCSLIGFLGIAYSTGSSWNRGVAVVALAPLALGILVGWVEALAEAGDRSTALGSVSALVAVLAVLFGTVYLDGPLLTPRVRIASGPYAGQWASETTARRLDRMETAGRRWVQPTDRVLFLGIENGYLLVGGRVHTCSVWLEPKGSDVAAIGYFERTPSNWPDVVFVDDTPVMRDGGYVEHSKRDPLLARILADYRRVGSADTLDVFVRR